MKCIANQDWSKVRRVHEHVAKTLVETGDWHYVTKGVWKRHVRPNLTGAKAKAAALVKDMGRGLRRV